MEGCNKRKRVQDDSELHSPESKIHRADPASFVDTLESQLAGLDSVVDKPKLELARVDSGIQSCKSEITRVDSGESCFDSELQDDLFNMLDDSENVAERDSAIHGLDSVIKSFEEEILAPGSDSLDPNLGFLFGASDDELGLPPVKAHQAEGQTGRVDPDELDITGFMGFEDGLPNHDALGFGVDEYDGGFAVADGGLLDYGETADVLWRSESLRNVSV
ncbi:hypothetical protein RIF29_06579 [Crotalaria pallida]|uniref:Uncharacterized protein n=1 Tax=Crotalaria pallida TaxID=3830 RepID=A0AAN9PBM0_CROPI